MLPAALRPPTFKTLRSATEAPACPYRQFRHRIVTGAMSQIVVPDSSCVEPCCGHSWFPVRFEFITQQLTKPLVSTKTACLGHCDHSVGRKNLEIQCSVALNFTWRHVSRSEERRVGKAGTS